MTGDRINRKLREAAGQPEVFRCSTGFCRTQDVHGTDAFIGREIIKDEMEFHVVLCRLLELYNDQDHFTHEFVFEKHPKGMRARAGS